MANDYSNIAKAKFQRDGKALKHTHLWELFSNQTVVLDELKKSGVSHFSPLIIYFVDAQNWVLLTDNSIIIKNSILQVINFSEIKEILSPLKREDPIKFKSCGMNQMIIVLRNDQNVSVNLEINSYPIVDGVLSYLLLQTKL